MPGNTPARLAAACAAAGLLVLAAPAAYADDPNAHFTIDDTGFSVDVDGGTVKKDFFWHLEAEGEGTVTDAVVTLDASGLAGLLDFAADDEYGEPGACTQDGTTWTCPIGDITYDDGGTTWAWDPTMYLTPRPGVTGVGEVGITLSAGNVPSASVTREVRVAEDIGLGIGERPDLSAGIGDTVEFGVSVTNTGDKPVYNPRLRLLFSGAELAGGGFAGCETATREGGYVNDTRCFFPVVLEPGETYELSAPIAVRIREDAYAPADIDSFVSWSTGTADEFDGAPGTGPRLTLPGAAPAPADTPLQLGLSDHGGPSGWNEFFIHVTGENKPNLVAIGDTVPAEPGTHDITIGVRNDGPATLPGNRSGAPLTAVWFDVPAGTEPALPEDCSVFDPDDYEGSQPPATYVCDVWTPLVPGESVTFTIPLTVTDVDLAATGTVYVAYQYHSDPQPQYDADPADSIAPIAFEGSDAAEDVAGGREPGTGLADTGVNAGVLAATGAAVIAAGGFAFWWFRRRNAYYGAAE